MKQLNFCFTPRSKFTRLFTLALCCLVFFSACKKNDLPTSLANKPAVFGNGYTSLQPTFENNQVKMWELRNSCANWKDFAEDTILRYLGVNTGTFVSNNQLKTPDNPGGLDNVSELDLDVWNIFIIPPKPQNEPDLRQHYNFPRSIKNALVNPYYKVTGKTKTKFKIGGLVTNGLIQAIKDNSNYLAFGFTYAFDYPQPKEGSELVPEPLKLNTATFFKTDKGENSKYGMVLMTQNYKAQIINRHVVIEPMIIQVWVQK